MAAQQVGNANFCCPVEQCGLAIYPASLSVRAFWALTALSDHAQARVLYLNSDGRARSEVRDFGKGWMDKIVPLTAAHLSGPNRKVVATESPREGIMCYAILFFADPARSLQPNPLLSSRQAHGSLALVCFREVTGPSGSARTKHADWDAWFTEDEARRLVQLHNDYQANDNNFMAHHGDQIQALIRCGRQDQMQELMQEFAANQRVLEQEMDRCCSKMK